MPNKNAMNSPKMSYLTGGPLKKFKPMLNVPTIRYGSVNKRLNESK